MTPVSPGSWIALARRRWLAGVGAFVPVLGVAAAVVLLSHPVHRSEARLRLAEAPPSTGVSPTAGILGLWRPGGDPFANDLELLGSRSVAEGVVEAAALHVRLGAPRGWHRDSLFVTLGARRDTERAGFRLEWTPAGPVRVTRTSPSDSLIGTFAAGDEVHFGGVTLVPLPWREGMPRRVDVSTLPFAEAVRLTRQQLTAERVRREANVLDLRFDHTDPAVTERTLAAWVDGFVAMRASILQRETVETVDSLRIRANETLGQLRAAEEAYEAFQRRSGLVAPDAQGEVFAERYGQALTALAELRFELEAARTLLARIEAAPEASLAWSELMAHPRFLENETVGALLTRLTELEARRREISLRRTEENVEHRMILEQMAELDGLLRSVAASTLTGLEEGVQRFESYMAELDAALAAMPSDVVEHGRLQRSLRLLTEVYVATEQRLRQEELREALTFANVQVIDPPQLRDRPVWPRRKLGMAVGFLFASAFALLAMAVAERADRTVRRASEIRAAIGAPVLAAVPWARNGAPTIRPHDVDAVLFRAETAGAGPPELVLAPVDAGSLPADLAGALAGVPHPAPADGRNGPEAPARARVTVVPPLVNFAAAAEAAGRGVPVTLLAVRGRTRAEDLQRAANLLAEAGGTVAGAILVCSDTGTLEDVWR